MIRIATHEAFEALLGRLQLRLDPREQFGVLEDSYAETHRAYHNLQHIDDCLAGLAELRAECERPDEVEFALWLHDVVYATRSGDSEERSADLAVDWLARGGASEPMQVRVHALVMATKHSSDPPTGDAAPMLDADLAILGQDAETFDAYEAAIRREYRWVPSMLYRKRRREILEAFSSRERIYHTPLFHGRYDAVARTNLARSIERLS